MRVSIYTVLKRPRGGGGRLGKPPITSLSASDDTAVTGYLVKMTAGKPSPGAAGWSGSAPSSYTFGSEGSKTLYAFAKDGAGNVSNGVSDSVTITLPPLPDTTAPTVDNFTIPATSETLPLA